MDFPRRAPCDGSLILCCFDVPLPIPAEIHARLTSQRQPGHAADLLAIGDAAVVLPPSGFLSEAEQVWPGDMVVMASLAATEPGEIAFRPIRAGAIERIGFLMIDAAHLEPAMQVVP